MSPEAAPPPAGHGGVYLYLVFTGRDTERLPPTRLLCSHSSDQSAAVEARRLLECLPSEAFVTVLKERGRELVASGDRRHFHAAPPGEATELSL